MNIEIDDVRDITKLLVAIRLMVKGKFRVTKDVLEEVLVRLYHFAKERGICIEIISPSGERIVEFTRRGIIVGAIAGYCLGQLPGALIGAVVGGMAGYCAAHVTLVVPSHEGSGHVIIETM